MLPLLNPYILIRYSDSLSENKQKARNSSSCSGMCLNQHLHPLTTSGPFVSVSRSYSAHRFTAVHAL